MKGARIYLLLGSNEGDRLYYLTAAVQKLRQDLATGPAISSAIYETAAWGKEDQASFLNMALGMDTLQTPNAVLETALQIEKSLGRTRLEHWGQRSLDIDILFYGDQILHTESLTIPHPHLAKRRFALVPIAEIAPEFIHPILGKSMKQLLTECMDPLPVERFVDTKAS